MVVVAMDGVGMASQGAASQPTMSLQLLQLDQPLGGAVTTHGPVESGHECVRGGRTASWQSEVTPVSRGSSAVRSCMEGWEDEWVRGCSNVDGTSMIGFAADTGGREIVK